VGNEGTSTSVLSGDPGRAAPASALAEMDAANRDAAMRPSS